MRCIARGSLASPAKSGRDLYGPLSLLLGISPLASVRLHRLKGIRKGQWAMTVNGPWRICFEFRKGDAYNVEIVDYHKG